MGTPTPEEFPDWIALKWYRVGVAVFHPAAPPGCAIANYWMEVEGCELGGIIKTWLLNELECTGWELIVITGFTHQRLLWGHGPYDTEVACQLDL